MAGIERESDARRHLQAEVAAQRRRDERQTARVNARGLPLIGFGIVMTGIPDGLATWAWVGWLFTAAGGVLAPGFGAEVAGVAVAMPPLIRAGAVLVLLGGLAEAVRPQEVGRHA